jgi:hypothetical protein
MRVIWKDVWVAVKITYSGDADSFALIDAFADIDFDTTSWEAKTQRTQCFISERKSRQAMLPPIYSRVSL